jgi:hypothetical protein
MAQLPTKLQPDMQTTKWKSLIDPLLKNQLNNVSILNDVKLSVGANKIAHKLGKKPQGWLILDINAAATIYRSQDFNDAFLTLTSSAAATISLGVF